MDKVFSKVRGIVNYFNLQAEELGLKDFQIAQRRITKEDSEAGLTIIEVKVKHLSGVTIC